MDVYMNTFDYNNLKKSEYYRENRLDAHSDHEVFSSYEALSSGVNELRLSLNGSWKFFYARNEQQIIPGFEAPEYDCKVWNDIPVPAHIQMEGYGVPQYTNVQYPWDGREQVSFGEIPNRFNPVACYVKYFFVPEEMQNKRVFASFEGAESCIAVWLNGNYVGFSSDTFTEHEFELTPYLTEGENKLACRVYRYCAGSWVEDQDFVHFSGLFRDVSIYAIPEVHVRDIKICTELDENYCNAVLRTKLQIEGSTPWAAKLSLKYKGLCVAEAVQNTEELAIEVLNPHKWSSEHPNLYDLYIELYDASNTLREVVHQHVGFRSFEIKNGMMFLNGKRIVFKGVNRHDFCAESGRAIPKEKIRQQLLIMKRNNINALRTSHYPNSALLYSLCDELGIYVIAENNMEAHGAWDMVQKGIIPLEETWPGDRADWLPMLLDRINSTYQRDKNHCSVVIWSCGNESLGGKVPLEMSRLFHRLDDTRPVHYECITFDRRYEETTDIESQMYTPLIKLREFLSEHRSKPFILCEYAHAMGNSNGALHEYTEYAYEEPLYQGGFIWDYIDQSILTRDRQGNKAYLYGGDFPGEYPNDGNFSGNGLLYGSGEVSPKMQEVKFCYQNIVSEITDEQVKIINRSLFTNTSEFDCIAVLQKNGIKLGEQRIETDVPPQAEKVYPLHWDVCGSGEYCITVSFRLKEDTPWAEKGYEVAFNQHVYSIESPVPAAIKKPLTVTYGINNLGIRGDDFEAVFSYISGNLVGYRYGGQELLKSSPVPNFWRAPTDNDRGCYMPQRYAEWKIASMYLSANYSPEIKEINSHRRITENADGSVSFSTVYGMPTTPKSECEVLYTVFADGTVNVRLVYEPRVTMPPMPEFGMLFKMDADYDRFRWYGLGPEENYCDRNSGAKLGIWETGVKDNLSHYLIPQECGNRTGIRWAEIRNARGRGIKLFGKQLEVSALPWTPHELENALHENELPPVNSTVVKCSLMQMGVGGDNSWGAETHDEYIIHTSEKLEFSFSFCGIV